ncbi:MAG: hypothetical protein IH898_01105, partial [Planctomycetes bacterium]|nr:hypothetical protein [Planctomycetota bacterium]
MDQPGDSPPPGVEPSLLEELESHATKLAREAGAPLLDYFQQELHVEYKSKGHQDPVTEADRRAEALLIDGIAARFPHHGILSEGRPEAIRADGQPDWFVLAGLIHDLGKILCLFGEPQWAVVGDTFPVGCAFSDRIVYPEFFERNSDTRVPEYGTACGIYAEGCGLDRVHL